MGSREESKSRRRDDIVRAARSLLRQPGVAALNMRTLATEAGVSIATPYNLFGSKQAILVAVLDEDFAEYQASLAGLESTGVDALFEAVALMRRQFDEAPDFYRNLFSTVRMEVGPELRFVLSGPRYTLWKNLLRTATEQGLLEADVDPDAFAITLSQLLLSNVQEWAAGYLALDEMDARIRYGVALVLSAVATGQSEAALRTRLREAEGDLQTLWRATLKQRLEEGTLNEAARAVLADQLKHIGTPLLEQPAGALPEQPAGAQPEQTTDQIEEETAQ